MIPIWFPRYRRFLRIIFSLILVSSTAYYVHRSIHWQVMWDTSIMHYVNFLMAHGLAPYRDILDNNLPGSYFVEGWAIQIFGTGDLGWRLYDFTLLAVLVGSLIVISLPDDWFAGFAAGLVFVVLHGSEGPRNAAQREQVMTTLMIAGYALLFTGLRRAKPWMFLPFGFLMGMAASLKPTAAPLAMLLLAMAAYSLRKRGVPMLPYLVYGVIGLALASSFDMAFLMRYHAVKAFLEVSKYLTRYYAGASDSSMGELLDRILRPTKILTLFVGLFLVFFIKQKREWENWERVALFLGICFGLFSYLAQRKMFDHHEYAFLVFLYLWGTIELSKAWKTNTWLHFVGLGCFSMIVLAVVPYLDLKLLRIDGSNRQTDAIMADLERSGGSGLQHEVQCFDMVDGCYSALNRLGLMPYTTFLGDYMFFPRPGDPPLPWAREKMGAAFAVAPPRVIVLTNMWLATNSSFKKLDQWPEMKSYVDTHYTLQDSHAYSGSAYRFYVLKDSPPALPVASLSKISTQPN
jgi:hypothetical protein